MKKTWLYKVLIVCLSLTIVIKIIGSLSSISYKDFEVLDGKKTHFWKKISPKDHQEIQMLKKRFLRLYPLISESNEVSKIPKILHYIWLGPKPFPEESKAFVRSWIEHHPDWIIKFWTDDMSRALPHPMLVKEDISQLENASLASLITQTQNYGERSDLLRYEILFKEGGIYIDHDIECFHSFSGLVSTFDFFAGLEPPHTNSGIETKVFPCNAIIGARPSHPILMKTIENVKNCWDDVEKKFTSSDSITQTLKVFHRTFHSFTLATKEMIGKEGNVDILFPASFFYSDTIVDEKTFHLWKDKKLILASHKCAGMWKPSDDKSVLAAEIDAEKAKKRYWQKKYKNLQKILYANFVLSGFCMYLLLAKRKFGRNICGKKSF
jgi:mannosyltransferase OCH1-like enzyme